MQSSHCLQKMTHRTLSHCRLAGAERHGAVARAFDLFVPPGDHQRRLPARLVPAHAQPRAARTAARACARHAPGTQFALVQCTLIMALVPDQRLLRMPNITAVFPAFRSAPTCVASLGHAREQSPVQVPCQVTELLIASLCLFRHPSPSPWEGQDSPMARCRSRRPSPPSKASPTARCVLAATPV